METVIIKDISYEYEEFDSLGENLSVLSAALKVQAKLIDQEFSDGLTFGEHDPVNALFYKGEVVGLMIYTDIGSMERTILLGWVHSGHRMRGLHSFMFNRLKANAQEHGFLRILRGHHKDNHESALAQISQGSQMYTTNGDYIYTRTVL